MSDRVIVVMDRDSARKWTDPQAITGRDYTAARHDVRDGIRAALDTDRRGIRRRIVKAIKAEQSTLSGQWGATPHQLAEAVLAAIEEGGDRDA